MEQEITRKFGKKDVLVIGMMLFVVVLSFAIKFMVLGEGGDLLVIEIDGQELEQHLLSVDYEGVIDTEFGRNEFVIRDGKAYMKEADCPDGLCIHQGKISSDGQTIVCLPHRLVLTVKTDEKINGKDANGQENSDITYDGVAK